MTASDHLVSAVLETLPSAVSASIMLGESRAVRAVLSLSSDESIALDLYHPDRRSLLSSVVLPYSSASWVACVLLRDLQVKSYWRDLGVETRWGL